MVNKTPLILFKKLFRMVKDNFKQFLSIIAISFLAICLFAGLTSNAKNLENRANKVYSESNFADIYVTTTSNKNVDYDSIKNIDGVEKVERRSYIPVKFLNKSINVIIEEDNVLSSPILLDGKEGFLVMPTFLADNKLSIGDNINITFENYFLDIIDKSILEKISSYVKEGKNDFLNAEKIELEYKITGSMYHPEGVQNSSFSSSVAEVKIDTFLLNFLVKVLENYDLPSSSSLSYQEVKQLIMQYFSNQTLIKIDEKCDKEEVLSKVKAKFESFEDTEVLLAQVSDNLVSSLALNQDVSQAQKLTYVFPIVFFLVSFLVIVTTLSQIILKERTQIGALKAIGVKNKDIYFHYISYGSFLCFLGGVLGFFIGPLIIPKVMGIKYDMLWDLPKVSMGFFHLQSILILLALVLFASLVSFLIVRNVLKEKAVDLLTFKTKDQEKKVIEKENKFVRKIPISIRLAFRNIAKNKVKTAMVILGSLGCTSLLVCGFGIMDSLNYGVDVSYKEQLVRDITISTSYHNEDQFESLKEIEGVKKVEKVASYFVSLTSESTSLDTNICLMEEDSICFLIPYEKGSVAIDKETADTLKITKDDVVRAKLGSQYYDIRVSNIFESSLLKGVYADYSLFEESQIPYTNYWLTLEDSTLENDVKDYILANYNFTSVETIEEFVIKANDLLGSIRMMTDVIKIFAVLLSIVVIYNLSSLNMNERRRDIATMKVLGFNYKEIGETLVTEILFSTFVGTIFGLVCGYPLCILVLSINKTNLLAFMYHIDAITYILALLLSLLTSLIVNIVMCLKLKNISMVESLKSVE